MVRRAYKDVTMFSIKPQYILSTDDSVVYTYQGKWTKYEKFMLVSSKVTIQSGKR